MFRCGYLSGGLWISPDANIVFPCCFTSKTAHKKFKLQSNQSDLFNSQILKDMRESAIKNKPHDLCKDCVYQIKNNIPNPVKSSNKWMNNNGSVKLITKPEDLEILYVSLSNICNFKCVMCTSSQSHLIAREEGLDKPLNMTDDTFFNGLIDLLNKAKNLKRLQVTGGEPFQNKKRLRNILESAPAGIDFHMHTNGSIMDDESIEIIKLMKKFAQSDIGLSLDGTAGAFEFQRTNGVWPEILDNIKYFRKNIKEKNILLNVQYTTTCFNVLDIPNFIDVTNGLIDEYTFHALKWPSEFQIRFVKEEYLLTLLDDLKKYSLYDTKEVQDAVQKALVNKPNIQEIEYLWKRIDYMRDVRGISLKEKLPQAYNFLYTM